MTSLYPWLNPYEETLGAVIRQDRVPHDLLLTDQPGMGQAVLAEIQAKMLLCEHPLENHVTSP